MISKELEHTFVRAIQDARLRRHELMTIEHLLFALLDDPQGQDILRRCKANLKELKRELDEYLITQPRVPEKLNFEVGQTIALKRVLQRAAIHVQSSGKSEIDAGDILAAMYREPESYAVYILKKQGKLESEVHDVPIEIEQKVCTLKLKSMSLVIDKLTPEQSEYLTTSGEGT